jgi:two-component system cell cycle response regulator CpdR
MEPKDHEANVVTVLVVDDDKAVLDLVSGALAKGDYKVLTAKSGSEGLGVSRRFTGEIQVLVSDFQMSAMSGIDLATAMTLDRPKLKVLLMSSFPQGLLVLNEGWHFLSKPFISSQISALVETLARPNKVSRFAGGLEHAELGEVKPPRLSTTVARYKASLTNNSPPH